VVSHQVASTSIFCPAMSSAISRGLLLRHLSTLSTSWVSPTFDVKRRMVNSDECHGLQRLRNVCVVCCSVQHVIRSSKYKAVGWYTPRITQICWGRMKIHPWILLLTADCVYFDGDHNCEEWNLRNSWGCCISFWIETIKYTSIVAKKHTTIIYHIQVHTIIQLRIFKYHLGSLVISTAVQIHVVSAPAPTVLEPQHLPDLPGLSLPLHSAPTKTRLLAIVAPLSALESEIFHLEEESEDFLSYEYEGLSKPRGVDRKMWWNLMKPQSLLRYCHPNALQFWIHIWNQRKKHARKLPNNTWEHPSPRNICPSQPADATSQVYTCRRVVGLHRWIRCLQENIHGKWVGHSR